MKNPYRYRGYRYDTETGLYYLNSRYYNPEWGRFINADALAGQVGNLLSHNVFAYCQNNFVTMSDPSGFMMVCITDDVSGVSNNIGISKSSESKSKNNKKKAYSQKTFWHETSKPSISNKGISLGSVSGGLVEIGWDWTLQRLDIGAGKIEAGAGLSSDIVGLSLHGEFEYIKLGYKFKFKNKTYILVQEIDIGALGGTLGYSYKKKKFEARGAYGFGYGVTIEEIN